VGLERGPLSLVRIIEELLEWKSRGPGLETRINGRRDPLRQPRDTLYPQKLALTSPTSDGRSVGIVRLRTKSHGVSTESEGSLSRSQPLATGPHPNSTTSTPYFLRSTSLLSSHLPFHLINI
jgi:hypothetical protein